jgi:hypothetical protein
MTQQQKILTSFGLSADGQGAGTVHRILAQQVDHLFQGRGIVQGAQEIRGRRAETSDGKTTDTAKSVEGDAFHG